MVGIIASRKIFRVLGKWFVYSCMFGASGVCMLFAHRRLLWKGSQTGCQLMRDAQSG
jgi:hypothetical protein